MELSAARATHMTAEGTELEADLSEVDLRQVAFGSPVRIPPSYARQRSYPGPFSSTNSAHVVYESRLELAWLWLADFDPEVVRIAAQPEAQATTRGAEGFVMSMTTLARSRGRARST